MPKQRLHPQNPKTRPVIWITGLAGAGKTTIAKLLVDKLRSQDIPVVHIDGDVVRETFNAHLSFSIEDRLSNAFSISKLCKLLSEQGINVVCSTMSLFPEIWEWNRAHLANYFEVYLRVSMEQIQLRNKKSLYSNSSDQDQANVVGKDLKFLEPLTPSLTLDNNKESDILANLEHLYSAIKAKL